MCNTNNYDPTIIAEKIKQECMRQNITVKTLLNRPAPPDAAADINAAVECIARARGISADYVRGVLRLPPNGSSSTNNDI